jgi:dienelactone hydrolase
LFYDKTNRHLDYEDVEIKSKDGVIIRGWLIKTHNSRNKPTVIFYHENAGSTTSSLKDYYL